MADHESLASLYGRLIGQLISIGLVVLGSILLYQKYGLAEAVAFFVLAGFLSDIRSKLIGGAK